MKSAISKVTETPADRLKAIERLVSVSAPRPPVEQHSERNLFTRALDRLLVGGRHYAPPLHRIGVLVSAFIVFLYARLVVLTMQLVTSGAFQWPNIPAPSVLALWHADAPSLLVAYAARRPKADLAIMISPDPRGDFLALLCRLLGFVVVRGGSAEGGWEALIELAQKIEQGACAVVTADGGGPARTVKVGALALASAARVPILPVGASCHPAIVERRKWDEARNPLPFSNVSVVTGEPRDIERLNELEAIERYSRYLQVALEKLRVEARENLDQPTNSA